MYANHGKLTRLSMKDTTIRNTECEAPGRLASTLNWRGYLPVVFCLFILLTCSASDALSQCSPGFTLSESTCGSGYACGCQIEGEGCTSGSLNSVCNGETYDVGFYYYANSSSQFQTVPTICGYDYAGTCGPGCSPPCTWDSDPYESVVVDALIPCQT
jgi:hypothetical protein